MIPHIIPAQILGNIKLLQLADLVEANMHYDQGAYENRCGTPGCALGTWAAANQKTWGAVAWPTRLDAKFEWPTEAAAREFALTWEEAHAIFGGQGCGGAGRSRLKAAAYIRRFVAQRV